MSNADFDGPGPRTPIEAPEKIPRERRPVVISLPKTIQGTLCCLQGIPDLLDGRDLCQPPCTRLPQWITFDCKKRPLSQGPGLVNRVHGLVNSQELCGDLILQFQDAGPLGLQARLRRLNLLENRLHTLDDDRRRFLFCRLTPGGFPRLAELQETLPSALDRLHPLLPASL